MKQEVSWKPSRVLAEGARGPLFFRSRARFSGGPESEELEMNLRHRRLSGRRRVRYSIRTLLLVQAVVASLLGCLAMERARARREEMIGARIFELGGSCLYDTTDLDSEHDPRPPEWVRKILGEYAFSHIVLVHLAKVQLTDDDFRHLGELKELKDLSLANARFDPHSLRHLSSLRRLSYLDLHGTGAAAEARRYLAGCPGLAETGASGLFVSTKAPPRRWFWTQHRLPSPRY